MNAHEMLSFINTSIKGRIVLNARSIQHLMEVIQACGHGDHVEIGALFGGSAIVAALAKKEAGLNGTVYSIDPFDGYYMHTKWAPRNGTDPISKVPVTLETAIENATACGVAERISFVKARSIPFPLPSHQFVSALIDGNHWKDWPYQDWLAVKDLTTHIVMIDDNDADHPSVQKVCKIAAQDPEWNVMKRGVMFIVERTHE